jgi:hypothetical protein
MNLRGGITTYHAMTRIPVGSAMGSSPQSHRPTNHTPGETGKFIGRQETVCGTVASPPETPYSGTETCMARMIQSYQGRPEIIVKVPDRLM